MRTNNFRTNDYNNHIYNIRNTFSNQSRNRNHVECYNNTNNNSQGSLLQNTANLALNCSQNGNNLRRSNMKSQPPNYQDLLLQFIQSNSQKTSKLIEEITILKSEISGLKSHIQKLRDNMDPMDEIKRLKETMHQIMQSEASKMKDEIQQLKQAIVSKIGSLHAQSAVIKQEQLDPKLISIHNQNHNTPQSRKRTHFEIKDNNNDDMEPNPKRRKRSSNTQYIKKALVITLCIERYTNTNIDDLPGAGNDHKGL